MRLRETMICWNHVVQPKPGLPGWPWAKAGRHPDRNGWSDEYTFSDGACVAAWRGYSADERLLRLFAMSTIMTVRDGVPPIEAHRALLEIDEYREALPSDVPSTPERIASHLAWIAGQTL